LACGRADVVVARRADTLTFEGSSAPVAVDLSKGGASGDGTDGILFVERVRGSRSDDELTGGPFLDTIWGGDGNDEINGLGGADRLFGDGGADTINGNAGDDLLDRGHDDDLLNVGPGDDHLSGESGVDTAAYSTSAAGVSVRLATNVATGDGLDDVDVENIVGSPFDDVLVGDAGPNTLKGLAGEDIVLGGGGDDRLDGAAGDDLLAGGPGVDAATFATAPSSVAASLTTNTTSGGAGHDELASVENFTGSPFDDKLTGNAASNVLSGVTATTPSPDHRATTTSTAATASTPPATPPQHWPSTPT
jgi:Ca2+-binding RTX toxin-like protein